MKTVCCRLAGCVWIVLLMSVSAVAQSYNMEFLGNKNDYPQPPVPTWPYAGCWGYTAPDGREYALLGVVNGTSIIDITDAPNLREVVFIPGPETSWREMKTYQQYAYIVNEHDTDPLAGMQILDLTNLPTSALLVKTYIWTDTVGGVVTPVPHAHNVSVAGNYLYLSGGGSYTGIRILDLTDPVNPVKAGYYSGPYIHDSYIRNDTIYASAINSGGGLDIIDARNKQNPQRIKLLQYPGSGTHNAWTTDDGRYVLTTDEIGATTKSLKVWDIRDIQNPLKVGEYSVGAATVHNVFVKGNLAYVAWYVDGLKVFDISKPTSPQLVGYYDTFPQTPVSFISGAWGAYPYYPSGKVIVSDNRTGLYVFRYTGPETAALPLPSSPTSVALHQNYPNPFNPTTTIQFDLLKETFVTLKLYDALGREISVVKQGMLPSGAHSVPVDARGLGAGVYFYTLVSSGLTATRRMVILK